MNKCELIGRLTKDPELKEYANGNKASFTVAVDRRFTNAQGNRETDFLPCVAWRGTADFIARYFHKGMKIAVTGSIQIRNYDAQDGSRRSITEINVEEAEFVEKKEGGAAPALPSPAGAPAEAPTPYDDDQLPF